MKSPIEIGQQLARHWYQSRIRVKRLLDPLSWPLVISIGKPSGSLFAQNPSAVQRHVELWRQVRVGEVEWEDISYRAGAGPISMPLRWKLQTPSEWIVATGNQVLLEEYQRLDRIVGQVDPVFHALLSSQRLIWLNKKENEVVAAADIAMQLEPACARGRPFRMLAEYGVDTKFFERNASLLTRLLDERFEGEASEQGLACFLDALDQSNHWVLLVPLSPGLLPYKRLRVTTAELIDADWPCSRVIAVENEQCLHLLPELPDTIAVLGSGLDLQWLSAPRLATMPIGYWGDIDTWGLLMLSRARSYCAKLSPLLMNRSVFDAYAPGSAVNEPVKANNVSEGLIPEEFALYRHLLRIEKGRLEQEYLPEGAVHQALLNWMDSTAS